MRALAFYNPEHRLLISGDALWERGYGLVMPQEIDPAALPAARATLEMLATLDVRIVIPGHGEPFTGIEAALERALERTAAFEADPSRLARHAVKALLMFALLDRQRLPLAELPAYLERVEVYREFNARFFRETPAELAARLVDALEAVGAAHRDQGFLIPS